MGCVLRRREPRRSGELAPETRQLEEEAGFPEGATGVTWQCLIPSPSYRNAHNPPEREAGRVWTAWPGRGLVGCPRTIPWRHLGALMTGKPGTLAGSPSKWGLTVAPLEQLPQRNFGGLGSLHSGGCAGGLGLT